MSGFVRGFITLVIAGATSIPAAAQTKEEFVPFSGQPGKDVVWVPSPEVTVAKMMEVGKVSAQDFVIDLGSGDGRNVIAAAKRGARGLGVEYNNDMVELSKRIAAKEGVAERAQFVQGDMYQADFSKANVLALFLLPSNLLVLRDKIFNLQPGTRVVLNTFTIEEWTPDEHVLLEDCESWCNVYLNIVPAKIAGTWRTSSPAGELTLTQQYQIVSGTFKTAAGQTIPVTGKLRGNDVTLTAEKQAEFTGRVNGTTIEGTQRPAGGGAPQAMTFTRAN
ncbi:MAG TPA: methyltransferase domain-containing protein [Vicinamibacterales bacterium]|jgi:precorrin-6B methylase 2|nr:methyltransferase domain-containing protein [Vicinamibacterales bacterium]